MCHRLLPETQHQSGARQCSSGIRGMKSALVELARGVRVPVCQARARMADGEIVAIEVDAQIPGAGRDPLAALRAEARIIGAELIEGDQ